VWIVPQDLDMADPRRLLLLLAASLAAPACVPGFGDGGPGTDDDSAAGDDDSAAGDDDSAAGDDDTGPFDDDGTEPPTGAGAYDPALVGLDVVPASDGYSVRSSVVTWDPVSGAFVLLYGLVTDRFSTHAMALAWEDGALRSSPDVQIEQVSGTQNSLEREVAASTGPDSRLLAVWEDDRLGHGQGYREVYGRFLGVSPGPVIEPLGDDFAVSEIPELEEYLPAVAWDEGAGRFLVAWSDDRDRPTVGTDARRLFGRTVGLDGSLGTEVRLGGDALWQVMPSIAGSGGRGRFLVVWGDYDPVGGSLDAGYRARVVDGATGEPVSDVLTLVRYGDLMYDRPAVAWQPWARAWLLAWTQPYTIRASWISEDGVLLSTGEVLAEPAEGAGAPRLEYAPATHSFVLAYHSWFTSDAWLQELDPSGVPVGERLDVNAATPPLGTFWHPVATSGDDAVALVAPSLDYRRITASVFVAS